MLIIINTFMDYRFLNVNRHKIILCLLKYEIGFQCAKPIQVIPNISIDLHGFDS